MNADATSFALPRRGVSKGMLLAVALVGAVALGCAPPAPLVEPSPAAGAGGGNGHAAPSLPPTSAADSERSVDACAKDAECTFVSLGCCSTTPVNVASVGAVKQRLEASGKPYCPPKSACGPGADGTFQGTPGRCVAGRCACDPASPLVANCRGE